MSVPATVRNEVKSYLYELAEQLGWSSLGSTAKSAYYDNWTRDPKVGGRLARYMDSGGVRTYLKDSLLKQFSADLLASESRPFRVLGISTTVECAECYVKPHGRRLMDGRVVCWGRAEDWKTILMALHERSYSRTGARPHAAVFTSSGGRYQEERIRTMVSDAATKLCVERLIWLDD